MPNFKEEIEKLKAKQAAKSSAQLPKDVASPARKSVRGMRPDSVFRDFDKQESTHDCTNPINESVKINIAKGDFDSPTVHLKRSAESLNEQLLPNNPPNIHLPLADGLPKDSPTVRRIIHRNIHLPLADGLPKDSPTGNREFNSLKFFTRISENQGFFMSHLFELCCESGTRMTPAIRKPNLAITLGIKAKTLEKAIAKLIDDGYISRGPTKSGPTGYTHFIIRDEVFEAIRNELKSGDIHPRFTHHSPNNSPKDSPNNSPKIHSSKLVSNINTNLLGDESKEALPEFLNVDISSLVSFGVYKKHLMDLHNQKQSFELNQMEDFIWKFREYVSDSEKVRGVRNIPALFVTLARQLASGYDPLESIQTPEQKLLEGLIERNKKALLELKRQKEESKALEFEIWFEKLNRQERDELAPPNSIVESGSELQKRSLMGYFDKAIWNG